VRGEGEVLDGENGVGREEEDAREEAKEFVKQEGLVVEVVVAIVVAAVVVAVGVKRDLVNGDCQSKFANKDCCWALSVTLRSSFRLSCFVQTSSVSDRFNEE